MEIYRRESILRFGLAALFFCTLVAGVIAASYIEKQIGDILLYFPAGMGFVQRVTPGEVTVIDLYGAEPAPITFLHAGRYAIYASDYNLLLLAHAESLQRASDIVSLYTGSSEPVSLVLADRPVMPFDTPFADGRPIYLFSIREPGTYTVRWPQGRPCLLDECKVSIAPDYASGNEGIIWLAYLIEVGLITSPFLVEAYGRHRKQSLRRQAEKVAAAPRQNAAEDFWQRELQSKREKGRRQGTSNKDT